MVKVRLMGLPDDVAEAAERLTWVFDVIEVSAPYPCRNGSRQVRVYADVAAKTHADTCRALPPTHADHHTGDDHTSTQRGGEPHGDEQPRHQG